MREYRLSIKEIGIEKRIEIDETQGFLNSDMDDAIQEFMEENNIEHTCENFQEKIEVEETLPQG